MKKDVCKYIIHHYFKQLHHDTMQLEDRFDEKAIHLFRVNVKKFRAFLRLLEYETGADLKIPHSIKKTYQLAGKIRDRQLCINRITRNKLKNDSRVKEQLAAIQKELELLQEEKAKLPGKERLHKMEQEMAAQLPEAPGGKDIKSYSGQQLAQVAALMQKGMLADEELHTVRKNIKDMIYLQRLFNEDLKKEYSFNLWNKQELEQATKLSHTLGLFNDTCIALLLLAPKTVNEQDIGANNKLSVLRRQWLAAKKRLKTRLQKEMAACSLFTVAAR